MDNNATYWGWGRGSGEAGEERGGLKLRVVAMEISSD